MKDITPLVRPNILALEPYSTARDDYKGSVGTFLDANENPYENGFNRYPDPHQSALKEVISKIKGIPVGQIFIGNGSDEAIDLCYRIFCEPGKDNAIMIAPSYGMYSVSAEVNDIEVRKVQLHSDFSLPEEELLAAADSRSKLMFICSPNNPTGNAFPLEQIERIVSSFGGMVVLDEAYIDFSSEKSAVSLLPKYDNLIVLQTLSKAYGLAGLRLGLAFSSEQVMKFFANVKYPYNIDSAAMQQAFKMLGRDVKSEVRQIVRERARVAEALAKCPSVVKVWPSDANFLLVEFKDARKMFGKMISEKVIVRDRSKVRGCEGCLRLTVGTPEENDLMLKIAYYEEGDIR